MAEEVLEARDVHTDAGVIISNAVKWSGAAGFIPVPYVDLAALGALQFKMVRDLAAIYDIDAKTKVVRTVVASLLGSLAPTVISTSLVGSSLKLIPGGGTLVGSASVAAFSAASTYAIGKVFVRHFENGGSLENFSAENIQEELKDEFASASQKVEPKSSQTAPKK